MLQLFLAYPSRAINWSSLLQLCNEVPIQRYERQTRAKIKIHPAPSIRSIGNMFALLIVMMWVVGNTPYRFTPFELRCIVGTQSRRSKSLFAVDRAGTSFRVLLEPDTISDFISGSSCLPSSFLLLFLLTSPCTLAPSYIVSTLVDR